MNTKIVRVVVEATIHEGKLSDLEAIAKQMTVASEKEPGTLGYEWYLSHDRKRVRLSETYADAAAVLAHFHGPVVQQLVPKMLEVAKLDSFEVYGDPGAEMRAMLAGFGAEIFTPWQGMNR